MITTSDTGNGGLANSKAGGNGPLGSSRPPDLFNQGGRESEVVDARVLASGEWLQMVRIDASRLLAKVVEMQSFRNRAVSVFVEDHVGQACSETCVSVPAESPRPDPTRGFVARIENFVARRVLAAVMAEDVINRLALHVPLELMVLQCNLRALTTAALAKITRIRHRVTSLTEVASWGYCAETQWPQFTVGGVS